MRALPEELQEVAPRPPRRRVNDPPTLRRRSQLREDTDARFDLADAVGHVVELGVHLAHRTYIDAVVHHVYDAASR